MEGAGIGARCAGGAVMAKLMCEFVDGDSAEILRRGDDTFALCAGYSAMTGAPRMVIGASCVAVVAWLRKSLRNLDVYTIADVCEVWGVDDVHVHIVPANDHYPREVFVTSEDAARRARRTRGVKVDSVLGKGATHAAAIRAACENGVAWRAAGGGGDA